MYVLAYQTIYTQTNINKKQVYSVAFVDHIQRLPKLPCRRESVIVMEMG